MSAELAAVLDAAANVIRRRGLHKNAMVGPTRGKGKRLGPVCTWTALAIAVHGTAELRTNEQMRAVKPAADALARFLGLDPGASDWVIPNWNDRPARTAAQVIAALESAARAERERAA